MFCSACGHQIDKSDRFCSGCGVAILQRSAHPSGTFFPAEVARDLRLLTGSRRAMKFVMIPLLAALALVALGGAFEVLLRGVFRP